MPAASFGEQHRRAAGNERQIVVAGADELPAPRPRKLRLRDVRRPAEDRVRADRTAVRGEAFRAEELHAVGALDVVRHAVRLARLLDDEKRRLKLC